jgi:hypothetical protein
MMFIIPNMEFSVFSTFNTVEIFFDDRWIIDS